MDSLPTSDVHEDAWNFVQVRYLVISLLMPLVYVPGAGVLLSLLGSDAPYYAYELTFYFYLQFIWCLIAYFTATSSVRIPFRKMIGDLPTREALIGGLQLSAWLFVASWAAVYWLFLPLSYWVPEFVTFWLIEAPDIIYYADGAYPILPNILGLVLLCVTAPLLEEFIFRGIILHRWASKYGVKAAVVWSSVLFAILHTDPLGAFLFGVGMSVLYLRSQSLLLPIICHSIYNFVVWLIHAGYMIFEGPETVYTLEQFQQEWMYGAIASLIAISWSVHWARRRTNVTLHSPPAS